MNILEELKISKKQNNNKRYDYLCKQFNAVDYAIKLEKYTIKLQQENKILKENAENNDKVVDKVNWENQSLKKENEQLKNNWNKLKDYIVKEYYIHLPLEASTTSIIILINKMQEIEDGMNESNTTFRI